MWNQNIADRIEAMEAEIKELKAERERIKKAYQLMTRIAIYIHKTNKHNPHNRNEKIITLISVFLHDVFGNVGALETTYKK